MKGKVSFYFDAPNIAKVRSRVENPSKEFSKEIRTAIENAVVEVINESTYKMRCALIKRFSEMGLPMKDAKAAAAVASPLNAFFDVFATKERPAGTSEESEETEETEEAAEAETEEKPAGKKSRANKGAQPADEKPADEPAGDEFED